MGIELLYFVLGTATAAAYLQARAARGKKGLQPMPSGPLDGALRLAYALARQRKQRLASVATLFQALLAADEIDALLLSAGVDTEALKEAIERQLEQQSAASTTFAPLTGWGRTREADDALRRTAWRVIATGRQEIATRDLLAELLTIESVEAGPIEIALLDTKIERSSLLFAVCHGLADGPIVLPRDSQALASGGRAASADAGPPAAGGEDAGAADALFDVVLYNDDHTTMEFVTDVLQQALDVSHDDARWLMARVHHEDRAHCGSWRPLEAIDRANRARALAREQGYPLRLAVEARSAPLSRPTC